MKKFLVLSKTFFRKTENCLFDLLFPLQCLGCGDEGGFLCDSCQKEIPLKSLQTCLVCEKTITVSGETCGLCKKSSDTPLKRLVVASEYQDPLLAKSIHLYKYKFAHELAAPLGKILQKSLLRHKVVIPDFIIAVPLHKKRLRWRGFNQANLLAEYLSKNLLPHFSIPVEEDILLRSRFTGPQMKVKGYQARFKNVAGSFQINPKSNSSLLARKNVLLVDDVCTTGATILECAKQLNSLRPKSITAVVLARQN